MADKKISQLTAATTPLAGTEVLPVVQGGTTVKVSVDNLTAGKAVSMAGLTATGDVSLNGGNFVFNDAGANKTARFEGDNDANLLVTDAVNDRIGVGTSAPATKLDVTGLFNGLQARFGFVAGRGLEISTTLSGGTNDAGSVLNAKGAGSGALIIQTDTVDRATFTSAGDLSIANGNLVQGTAAKGINFSANTGAAGKTSSLLNWYEEGTWTPAFTLQSGSVTLATALGRYTRIGRQVTLNAYIKVDTPSSPSGFMLMTGLPFPPADISGNNLYAGSIIVNTMLTTVTGNWVVQPRLNGDLRFYVGDNTSLSNPGANLQADSEIWLTCTYVV